MQALNVIGLMDHIDAVITVLGKSGVFHADEVSNFYTDTRGFTRLQTKNNYAEPLTNLKSALNQAKRDIPLTDVSDFNPTPEEMESFSETATAEIDALTDRRSVAQSRLETAQRQLQTAEHFVGFDEEVQKVLQMRFMQARFGRLPKDSMKKLEAYKDDDYIDFAVCTEDDTHYWGVYFAPKDEVEDIDRIFEGLYFESADLGSDRLPSETIEECQRELPDLERQVHEAQHSLDTYLDTNGDRIARYLSKLEEMYTYAGIRSKALQHNNSFIIVGWIPTENKLQLQRRLKKIKSVELDFSDAKGEMDKNPPVKLKNCFLAQPFEFYTYMYGVPKYNEIDPTFFVAITYTIIFGIMFADLGQGIILSIVGLLMWKLKKMPIGKILFPCGIASAVFGTVFGSVFGFEDALNPLFRMVGFKEKPIEVMDGGNTNIIIMSAIGLGVFLLIVAMFLNVYTSFRQKNYGRALFSTSGIAGIVFYVSLVAGLVCEIFLGIHVMTLPYILGLVVLPFLLIFFAEPLGDLVNGEKDWQPESWGGYIVENLFESIEVLLGYVTNTMSFLRVGAFVLVHAGMMLVVFVLAETVGGVGYWAIVVIGNALVMVLEALLVAIQVLRLEYYEMFSRFYSGEGRPFELVGIKN